MGGILSLRYGASARYGRLKIGKATGKLRSNSVSGTWMCFPGNTFAREKAYPGGQGATGETVAV
ncbi:MULTISPECIES: hypothetical protein [Bacteroides]|uniref:hypothetical protein n=1 Tax=Bacteroides TaxID=816 RepID=UPI001484F93F|nr:MULTISPECIES: hypothetical protein [Bacteroides]MCE9164058.1 hypothetical protein [Bacteroides ovatus]